MIGIVVVENDQKKKRVYVGCGEGLNQKADEQHIADWGSPVSVDDLVEFFLPHGLIHNWGPTADNSGPRTPG